MSKSKLKLTFLVTGCAGFIGSHLVDYILSSHPQCNVIGLDNLTSGTHSNLVDAQAELSKGSRWKFCLITEDIRNLSACREAVKGVDIIIHLAAKCSVPDSFNSPIETHDVNVGGFFNVILAATESKSVRRLVYASSSSVYGTKNGQLSEDAQLCPGSPYAATKVINEVQANAFTAYTPPSTIGLRLFNVYGARQSAEGAYAAVVPKLITQMISGQQVTIHGNGRQTRDFISVKEVARAIMLAALAPEDVNGQIFNVGTGVETQILQLFKLISTKVGYKQAPRWGLSGIGDASRSVANTRRIFSKLGFVPKWTLTEDLVELIKDYKKALLA